MSQQVDHKVEQFATWLKLARGPTAFAALAHLLMGLAGRIALGVATITAKFAADGLRTAIKHLGDGSLAQPLKLAKLEGDAFFNTEFVIRHRHTVPDWSGVALSFCRRQVFDRLGKAFQEILQQRIYMHRQF